MSRIEVEPLHAMLDGLDALRVRKRPIAVRVAFAATDGTCRTLEGHVRYRAGDALLNGEEGEQWPMRRADFDLVYRPIRGTRAGYDGSYVKVFAAAVAWRLDRDVKVPVGWRADPLDGQAGDWLLRYADDTLGIVQDDIFRSTYEADTDERRWPPPVR